MGRVAQGLPLKRLKRTVREACDLKSCKDLVGWYLVVVLYVLEVIFLGLVG